MDLANRALCFALRNPGTGIKKTPLADIIKKKLVRKTDGTVPTAGAISEIAKNFKKEKGQDGRKKGSRNTTKAEDRTIMSTFKKIRPPGAYVDSRMLHENLPQEIQNKIGRKTVLSRLAEKGYRMQDKLGKTDLGDKDCKRRLEWCRKYKNRLPMTWKKELQGVGDIKIFTYYPKALRGKFKRLRASRTIMTAAERRMPAFQRPKKWFKKEEWKTTKQQKLFSLTLSTGTIIAFLLPSPFNSDVFA